MNDMLTFLNSSGAIYSQTSVALQMATITFPPPGLGIIPVVSICLPATW